MSYTNLCYRNILHEPEGLSESETTWPLTMIRPEALGRIKQLVLPSIDTGTLLRFRGFGFVVRLAVKDGVLHGDFWHGLGRPEVNGCPVELVMPVLMAGRLPLRPPEAVMRVMHPETSGGLPVLEADIETKLYEAWWHLIEPAQAPLPTIEVLRRLEMGIAWTWLIETDPNI